MKNQNEKTTKCETILNCKASASLQEEIKEDLIAEDKSLKEIIENDEKQKN